MSMAILATTLVACASSGAPTWTLAPVPPSTTEPEPVAATCPAGSTPGKPGPADQARPVLDSPTAMAFDRRAGTIVAITGPRDGVETWTFDVCANTWTQMHPNREPSSFEWAEIIYDIDSDATILVAYGTAADVWVYDLGANTWAERGAAPTNATAVAFDPLTGLVVAAAEGLLWNYEVETDAWTQIHQANAGTADAVIAYDTSVDRIVAFEDQTSLFDIRTGTWSTTGTATPRVIAGYGMQAPKIEYDEAAKRTVVFGNGQLAVYDAAADRWEVVDEADNGGSLPLDMVYDPMNRRLVGLWGSTAVQDGAVAFDLVARERTILLEPSDARPTPSSE